MALFRPYQQGQTESKPTDGRKSSKKPDASPAPAVQTPVAKVSPEVTAPQVESGSAQKKGRPTPTREQALAERRERLNPTLTPKEQRKRDKQVQRTSQMARYDAAENTPGRVLVRDYVDDRWTFTEFVIPTMLVIMAMSLASSTSLFWQQLSSILMLVVFFAWALNIWWVWRGFKKQLKARYPDQPTRGLLLYLTNRMITIRRWRRPAPRHERGKGLV
ncbi:MAG TPA: DUF3043 domain-containing protein [Propionibacteriaceae bacterium]|nr:DUF3043 domain-containing protein [Propionibacteriaceae bacterium]